MALFVIVLPVVLLSCASVGNHEAFINYHENRVGRNFDQLPRQFNINEYTDSTFLSNGNVEYGLIWKSKCHVYYEVDPETRIILDWRWEGSQGYCTLSG